MVATATAITDLLATRLYLDGQWSVDDFELFFRAFNDLYRLIAAFTVEKGSVESFVRVPVPFHRRRLVRLAREQGIAALRVLRLNYSSPGQIDLLGVGKVAEVVKDTLFGIADRIINSQDRELDRERKFLENDALQVKTALERSESHFERAQNAKLHDLAIAEKKIAIERAAVALTTEKVEAAAKGLQVFKDILALSRDHGASEEDISRILAGFVAKVEPLIPLILEGKLLSTPSPESPKFSDPLKN
jgi:hypothetical protein